MQIVTVPPGGNGIHRVIIYGAPGVGKTQLALSFPSPVFLCTEEGLGTRSAARFDGKITRWSEIDTALGMLYTEEHSFKTFVIDSLDWAEPLIEAEAGARHGCDDITSLDFGRGYGWAREVWRELTTKLDLVAEKRAMSIVLLSHATTGDARDPGGEKYTSWGLSLPSKCASHLIGWSDEVWFLTTDIASVKNKSGDRLAKGSGDRVVHTAPEPGFVAKSRCLEQSQYNCGNDKSYSALLSQVFGGTQK